MPPKRKDLTLREKIQAIDEVERGSSIREISRRLEVSHAQIIRALKNKETLREAFMKNENPVRKRQRQGKEPQVDEKVLRWFGTMRAKGVEITGPLIIEKAQEISKELDCPGEYTCSWLEGFKHRHHIRFKKLHGESKSADSTGAENWLRDVYPGIIAGYKAEDIFNADETGLCFRATPDGSYVAAGEEKHGRKKGKERLTVLLAANLDGSDKLKPLVIGKSKNPRCFKRKEHLPTHYDANKTAWMTSVIFANWLWKLNIKMKLQDRKVILFIDQCPAHNNLIELSNVRVVYLPPNTTSLLQPLDGGIIKTFKAHYRKLLSKNIIMRLDANVNDKAEDAAKSVSVLDALEMIKEAWGSVTPEAISNCFKKVGMVSGEEHYEEHIPEEFIMEVAEEQVNNGRN